MANAKRAAKKVAKSKSQFSSFTIGGAASDTVALLSPEDQRALGQIAATLASGVLATSPSPPALPDVLKVYSSIYRSLRGGS